MNINWLGTGFFFSHQNFEVRIGQSWNSFRFYLSVVRSIWNFNMARKKNSWRTYLFKGMARTSAAQFLFSSEGLSNVVYNCTQTLQQRKWQWNPSAVSYPCTQYRVQPGMNYGGFWLIDLNWRLSRNSVLLQPFLKFSVNSLCLL